MSSDKVIQTNYGDITCFEVMNRWIDKYFAGELFDETAVRVDNHLQECERCNGHLRSLALDNRGLLDILFEDFESTD